MDSSDGDEISEKEELKPFKELRGWVIVRDDGRPYLSTFSENTGVDYKDAAYAWELFMRGEGLSWFRRLLRGDHYQSYYEWRGYRIVLVEITRAQPTE